MIQNVQTNFFINFQGRKCKYTTTQKQLAMRFEEEGLTLDDAKKITEKFPKLENGKPYTMEYNIREFVKLHKEDGLTIEKHLEAAKKEPSLFASNPMTLSKNINTLYDFVSKYGFSKSQIIELQDKNPILRAMSGETIVRNLTDIPKRYKQSGLKEEYYVKEAFKDVFLLGVTPARFEGNLNKYLEHFSDLEITEKDLIKTFKKQRVLVTMSAENVITKLDLWRYIEENKLADSGKSIKKKDFKDLILRKNLSHSIDSILTYLLRCKLNSYYGTKIPAKKYKEPIMQFLKENANKTFSVPVLKGNFAEIFEKFISNLSIEAIGKNAFKVIVK